MGLRTDSNSTRVAFTLERGNIVNLLCCGLYGACLCPYNVWGVYIWLEDNTMKWEIQRESSFCVHCCFSGLCGLMVLRRQYNSVKSQVSDSLSFAMRAKGGDLPTTDGLPPGGAPLLRAAAPPHPQRPMHQPPQYAPEYTAPTAPLPPMTLGASAPSHVSKSSFVVGVGSSMPPVPVVPVAVAWVVSENDATYDDAPVYAATAVDAWIQNDDKRMEAGR